MSEKKRKKLGYFTNLKLLQHKRAASIPNKQDDSALLKSYNYLYVDDNPNPSSSPTPSPLELQRIFSSRRFFFSPPGRSNSISESSPSLLTFEPESSSWTTTNGPSASKSSPSSCSTSFHGPAQDPLPVRKIVTVSTDPYGEFRKSMQEMAEARGLTDVRTNWKELHELLLCYLGLNPTTTHSLIISAFSDLLVTLLLNASR